MRSGGLIGGCLALIVGVALLSLALPVLRWAGIPIGLALAAFCYFQFRRYDSDPEGFDLTAYSLSLGPDQLRRAALGGIAVGILTIVISATLLVMGWNADRTDSRLSPQPSASRTPPSRVDDRTTGRSETPAQTRERVERAMRWCRDIYGAYDPGGSGYAVCMRRRGVSASDFEVISGDAGSTDSSRRAEQMAASAEYCRRNFSSNPDLQTECLDNERRLHGW